ncbi:beta-eliminating lyase-related protein [Burkholderiaceae bacterium FT117]|uniref:threonine aldolase family protein n=1 Tax=Zeimonas sediminis TaxID=2944268 RepID=UPI002342FA00|nr:GntG family PLP-dependent aldolase [Zeimonas sediminis]MCM5570736.1 beta-eliminating lyase-related protein [Zeimonas sediminis]
MILLTSDTETRPTAAMRAAIAAAEVGDEQKNEDPTVLRLTERVAQLLGKEAALFLPSGTMCNVIAVRAHTSPGEVVLAERDSHVLRAEGGGAGMISGVMTEPLESERGVFGPGALDAALDRIGALPSPYGPRARLLCLENTHNFGGGTVWPQDRLDAVCDAARARGLKVHLDGARLMNAAVANGLSPARICEKVDTAWLDFTKGLGAPIGAVLVGSREFVAEARRLRQMVGGAMRQAGIAAAACLHALDHHVERLAEDHENARRLAEGLQAIPGVRLVHGLPETNIVFFDPRAAGWTATDFAKAAAANGVKLVPVAGMIRAVTHLDVTREQIDEALAVIRRMMGVE